MVNKRNCFQVIASTLPKDREEKDILDTKRGKPSPHISESIANKHEYGGL